MWIPCPCGRTFRDQSHDGRVEARWFSDREYHEAAEELARRGERLARVVKNGDDPTEALFGPDYPRGGSLNSLAHDLLIGVLPSEKMWECPRCGRLLLLAGAKLVSYSPEHEERGMFGLTEEDLAAERERLKIEERAEEDDDDQSD